jgi:hypothetical protein
VHSQPGSEDPSPGIPDLPPVDPNDRYDEFVPQPLPPPHGRLPVQVILFVLTFLTTTIAGGCHYQTFMTDLATVAPPEAPIEAPASAWALVLDARLWNAIWAVLSDPWFYLHGLWYSLAILAILGCHELGHYVACLRYNVIATRPYFLPVPPFPFITGTLGAFIRIRTRIPHKVALFDIAFAGPIAGFLVAVPLLFLGLALSRVDRLPEETSSLVELGEPLMFRLAAWMVWGDVADGYSINMHPTAFAAWFGLLATALNLFPMSQLDGGHIAYAVFGRRSTVITFITIAVAIGLTFVSSGWIVWTALMIGLILMVGPHHPPTLDDEPEIGRGRLLLAAFSLVMLIVCFTPAPIGEFVGGASTDTRSARSENTEKYGVRGD